jgi:hypothetical protein
MAVISWSFAYLQVPCSWKSYVSDYPALDLQTQYGPTFEFEYSTREAYGGNITWGATDPLNATWWHLVTERACVPSFLPSSLHISFQKWK